MKLIITLILILVIIGIILIAFFCIRKKVRDTSQALFGTPDITQAAVQMKQEYATTPKSVSSMTSLLLPKISADFPDFEYNEMKDRANNVLVSFLRAITTKDENALSEGSRELKQQLENHIEMLRAEGRSEHFDQVKLHRTEIYQYRKTDGKCIITFQTSLECFHYTTDENSQILEGDRQYKYQTKFNTDLIYVQDVDKMKNDYDDALAVTCPNCGAPIPMLGAKHCEYCGCTIIELNIHAWAFHHVEEITAKSNALK